MCVYGVPMCVDTCGMCVETQSGRQKSFSALLHLSHGVGVPQLNLELTDGLGWLAGSFQGSSVFIFLVLEFQAAIYVGSEDLSKLFTPVTSALATEHSPLLPTSADIALRSHFCEVHH